MDDQNTDLTPAVATVAPPVTATIVRGRYYDLGGKVWDKGTGPRPI